MSCNENPDRDKLSAATSSETEPPATADSRPPIETTRPVAVFGLPSSIGATKMSGNSDPNMIPTERWTFNHPNSLESRSFALLGSRPEAVGAPSDDIGFLSTGVTFNSTVGSDSFSATTSDSAVPQTIHIKPEPETDSDFADANTQVDNEVPDTSTTLAAPSLSTGQGVKRFRPLSPPSALQSNPKRLAVSGPDSADLELAQYSRMLQGVDNSTLFGGNIPASVEEIKTTPLFIWSVKTLAGSHVPGPFGFVNTSPFTQFAVIGAKLPTPAHLEPNDRAVFLNTNAPWSAFLCGSQGSGKSYTLSCLLENCLMDRPEIGINPNPLTGIVFAYDMHSAGIACEAAHLGSHLPVKVLVSPSNYREMKQVYENLPNTRGRITVHPLLLNERHLNTARVLKMMSAEPEASFRIPLYMDMLVQLLREMAITSTTGRFSYTTFLARLKAVDFTKDQATPLGMRLKLLDSFMDCGSFAKNFPPLAQDTFKPKAGELTIVDLSDPFIDADSACSMFEICLALFLEDRTGVGKVIALDEAHKFLSEGQAAAQFTQSLLQIIREQRHKGARIIISTQEPTISSKLMDLCSMTFVHRFTSPDWFRALTLHLVGASLETGRSKSDSQQLFNDIVALNVGESMLFSPSALLDVNDGQARKLGSAHVKFKTRFRLTADGGKSVLASTNATVNTALNPPFGAWGHNQVASNTSAFGSRGFGLPFNASQASFREARDPGALNKPDKAKPSVFGRPLGASTVPGNTTQTAFCPGPEIDMISEPCNIVGQTTLRQTPGPDALSIPEKADQSMFGPALGASSIPGNATQTAVAPSREIDMISELCNVAGHNTLHQSPGPGASSMLDNTTHSVFGPAHGAPSMPGNATQTAYAGPEIDMVSNAYNATQTAADAVVRPVLNEPTNEVDGPATLQDHTSGKISPAASIPILQGDNPGDTTQPELPPDSGAGTAKHVPSDDHQPAFMNDFHESQSTKSEGRQPAGATQTASKAVPFDLRAPPVLGFTFGKTDLAIPKPPVKKSIDDSKQLCVENLPKTTSKADLMGLFGFFAAKKIKIESKVRNKHLRAFIDVATHTHGKQAIDALHGRMWRNCMLSVEFC